MDDYLVPYPEEALPPLGRELGFLFIGLFLMILSRVFLWNSGIELDQWMMKLTPAYATPVNQSCNFQVVGEYSLGIFVSIAAVCGAISGWIGIWNLYMNFHFWPESREGALNHVIVLVISLVGLILTRAISGAASSRGGTGFLAEATSIPSDAPAILLKDPDPVVVMSRNDPWNAAAGLAERRELEGDLPTVPRTLSVSERRRQVRMQRCRRRQVAQG